MASFSKTLALATLALCAGVVALASFWNALHPLAAALGVLLMAANAWAAVGALKLRFGMDPVRLVLVSMLARLLAVAGVMLAVIRAVEAGPALYSFVFAAMAAYAVFQAVEIRHVVRHPELLAR